jgi:hypothetical protein
VDFDGDLNADPDAESDLDLDAVADQYFYQHAVLHANPNAHLDTKCNLVYYVHFY